jgi:quercetin dioxygenase-like cupin family protein
MQAAHVDHHSDFVIAKMAKNNMFESERMYCDVYCLEPGQYQRVHNHAEADKVYYVIDGAPTVEVDGERRTFGPGHTIWAPAGSEHGVTNESAERTRLLVFMAPCP